MNRLRDMLIEYKLVMSWEDERQMEIGSKGH
jgi:plasmid rolling circle replication initiator protein Rep